MAWRRIKRKYRRKKPVRRWLRKLEKRVGLGGVLDPFIDEIRFSQTKPGNKRKRTRWGNMHDYYSAKKRKYPLAITYTEEKEAEPPLRSYLKMPYGRKRRRPYKPKRFRRKRRKFSRKRISKSMSRVVGRVLRKKGIATRPRNRYAKMNFQQVTWGINERGHNVTTLMDYDGDIQNLYTNTQTAYLEPSAAAGAKMNIMDPGLEVNTNNIPARIHLISAQRKLTYRNNCLNDVEVRYYIIIPKQDLDATQTVVNVWTSDLGYDVTKRTSIADASLDNTFTAGPTQSPDFRKKFKVLAKGHRMLKPGAEMSLTMKVHDKTLDITQLSQRKADLTTLNYVKGLTKAVYTIWQGTLGHDPAATTKTGLLGGLVDIRDVYSYTWKFDIGAASEYTTHYLDDDGLTTGQQAGWNAELE